MGCNLGGFGEDPGVVVEAGGCSVSIEQPSLQVYVFISALILGSMQLAALSNVALKVAV